MTDERSEALGRSIIPAELRRRVLVEAGHRCAIPTCRYIEADIHHIVPWAQCHAHDYHNLIALCPNCHRRADRGEIDRKSLLLYKANLRFTHDRFSQLEVDVLFDLYGEPPGSKGQWPPFMHIMLRRIIEAGLVRITANPIGAAHFMGMQVSPDFIELTPKGRTFMADLGLVEL